MKYIVPVDMHYETELAQKQIIFFHYWSDIEYLVYAWYW